MTQMETIEKALAVLGEPLGDDPVEAAIYEVLNATLEVKKWEAEEGDASECECRQCKAAVAFAQVIIEEEL
jgi:hypothetical protein